MSSFVNKVLGNPDPHLQPATSLCWPCDVKYDVIVHVETLREDFEYLTRHSIGVIMTNFSFNHMMEEVSDDVVQLCIQEL